MQNPVRPRIGFVILVLLSSAMMAQTGTKNPAASTQNQAGSTVQLKGLDTALIDKSVDPCSDFYQYSCGGWLKQNPIPADQAAYGRGTELAEQNRLVLKDILEKAAAQQTGRAAVQQKIGDFYSACMDESAIERKGASALKPEWSVLQRLSPKLTLPMLSHICK